MPSDVTKFCPLTHEPSPCTQLERCVILSVLLRYLTNGLILTRIETSLSLGMEYNKKSEVVTHALPGGRWSCWNLLPSTISEVKNLSTHRFVA